MQRSARSLLIFLIVGLALNVMILFPDLNFFHGLTCSQANTQSHDNQQYQNPLLQVSWRDDDSVILGEKTQRKVDLTIGMVYNGFIGENNDILNAIGILNNQMEKIHNKTYQFLLLVVRPDEEGWRELQIGLQNKHGNAIFSRIVGISLPDHLKRHALEHSPALDPSVASAPIAFQHALALCNMRVAFLLNYNARHTDAFFLYDESMLPKTDIAMATIMTKIDTLKKNTARKYLQINLNEVRLVRVFNGEILGSLSVYIGSLCNSGDLRRTMATYIKMSASRVNLDIWNLFKGIDLRDTLKNPAGNVATSLETYDTHVASNPYNHHGIMWTKHAKKDQNIMIQFAKRQDLRVISIETGINKYWTDALVHASLDISYDTSGGGTSNGCSEFVQVATFERGYVELSRAMGSGMKVLSKPIKCIRVRFTEDAVWVSVRSIVTL